MELIEANPLPQVCQECTQEDCYNCDYAGLRWYLSEESAHDIRQKMLGKAIARLQKRIKE